MSLPCRPYVQWGYSLESSHSFELPQMPWNYGFGGVGGSDTAASGIPESYSIRDDHIRLLRWRVLESEMSVFLQFLQWARNSGQPFNFRFDADDATTEYSVYLHSLRWEDVQETTHERDGDYELMFVIPLSIRTELGGAFAHTWASLAVA